MLGEVTLKDIKSAETLRGTKVELFGPGDTVSGCWLTRRRSAPKKRSSPWW